MYLGIDLGTSGIKVVLINEEQAVVASKHIGLSVQRPAPMHSEQNPQEWWETLDEVMLSLKRSHPELVGQVKAIGLSGQMHGATLLDANGNVIRPAILWNDGRSIKECAELEQLVPALRNITGNIAMPGFTAPKIKWLQKHEPEHFASIDKVLLPKDYLRYRMSGVFASDMSDSAGTLWLDVAKRAWSEDILTACGLSIGNMPELYEGSQMTGLLLDDIATRWALPLNTPIVGGGGDNAAGAVGSSTIAEGQAFLSLGTSGVIFTSSDNYKANPAEGVHSFCHAVPHLWHQMSVILSAASCIDWGTQLLGLEQVSDFLALAEDNDYLTPNAVLFLPYLSGERTPHNNPKAKGVLFGLTHDTNPKHIARAILEGIAFAFKDGMDALTHAKVNIQEMALIGGGARSELLCSILANVLGIELVKYQDSELGPAFGAARLAMLNTKGTKLLDVCRKNHVEHRYLPTPEKMAMYKPLHRQYRNLYQSLKNAF